MDVYRKEGNAAKEERRVRMRENICTVVGVLGGFIAMLLGGWDTALITLVIFMAVDFITGIIGAALGKSKHSWTGKLSSKAGWYGLAKKVLHTADYCGRSPCGHSHRNDLRS